jgi:hypothetical protein
MKRFYVQLFKKMNPKMRLRENSVNDYLEASKKLIESLDGCISVNLDLKYFIAQMVSTKLISNLSVGSELEESLMLLNTCLYSYSDKAMTRIFNDSSARILFNFFYTQGQDFFRCQKNVKNNLPEYLSSFERIYAQFNQVDAI